MEKGGRYDEGSETEGAVLVAAGMQGVRVLHVRNEIELDDAGQADLPGVRKMKNMYGVLGRPDPVAWKAMADVMLLRGRHRRMEKRLADAREAGHVSASLGLCREFMACEAETLEACRVCQRLAGQSALEASLAFGG